MYQVAPVLVTCMVTRQGYKLLRDNTLLSGSYVLLQLSAFYNQLRASTTYHTGALYIAMS